MMRPMLVVALVLFSESAFAQTQNYFGVSGSLGGSTWSTNPAGPYDQLFNNTGGGVMNFNNVASVTGGTVSGVSAIFATANVTLTLPSGTISNLNNGIVGIDVSNGVTLDFSTQSFTSSATAGYIKNGAGVLALAGNTYQGGFTLNNGTVIVRGVNAMGGGVANMLALNGGVLAANASRDLSNKYGGGITIGGDVQFGAATGLASASASLTFNNAVSLGNATRTLTIGNNAATTFNGAISGDDGLTIAALSGATGRITLGGANTYQGATTINSGVLRLAVGNDRLPTGTAVTLANVTGAALDLFGFNQQIASLSGGGSTGGNVILGAGILTISGNANTTFGGAISGDGGIVKSGNGTLTLTGTSSFSSGITINSGAVLANGPSNSTGTGTITVNNSATFGGTGAAGTTGVSVIVAEGGTIAAGTTSTVGTLTVNGGVTLSGAYSWNLSATAAGSETAVFAGETDAGSVRDLIIVGAGIAPGLAGFDFSFGTINVDALDGVSVEAGKFYSWKIIQLTNGVTARVNSIVIGATPVTTNFFIGGLGADWGEYSLTSSGGFVFLNLEVNPVPEPSSIALVSIILFGRLAHRRLRRTENV
jgi:autotransporter-associated beta strand protein